MLSLPPCCLNGEPNGGFNVNEYKGDKIALRRIHSGSYIAGSPSTEANRSGAREVQHRVALSKPFYIGIFEITQRQYLNVMGGTNPSGYTGDFRPVETVLWRGTVRAGSWPGGAPAANTFMDKLLQEGVRTPRRRSEILPFEYSSTNWIGDVAGVTSESIARVAVVQLEGTDPCITNWTEVAGTEKVLKDAVGEGEVLWRAEVGRVWKATFEITTAGTVKHAETCYFDLRKTKGNGLVLYLK